MPTYAKTLTDVAKIVMLKLGQTGPIADIEAPAAGSKAEILNGLMNYSIEAVQDEYIWGELMTTARPDVDPVRHNNGFYRWRLQEDCVHFIGVRPIRDAATSGTPKIWVDGLYEQLGNDFAWHRFEDGYVLTQIDDVEQVYIKRSYNPAEWHPPLLKCVIGFWAKEAALAINPSVALQLLQEYQQLTRPFSKYRASKSNRRGTNDYPMSDYSRARFP